MGHLMSENSYFGHWVWVVVESKQHWAKTENGCYCSPLYLWRCRTSMLSVESTGGWGWNRATSQISILKVPRKKKNHCAQGHVTKHEKVLRMGSCWLWNRSTHKQTNIWAASTQVKPTRFHIKCVMILNHREKVTSHNDVFVRQIKKKWGIEGKFFKFQNGSPCLSDYPSISKKVWFLILILSESWKACGV